MAFFIGLELQAQMPFQGLNHSGLILQMLAAWGASMVMKVLVVRVGNALNKV